MFWKARIKAKQVARGPPPSAVRPVTSKTFLPQSAPSFTNKLASIQPMQVKISDLTLPAQQPMQNFPYITAMQHLQPTAVSFAKYFWLSVSIKIVFILSVLSDSSCFEFSILAAGSVSFLTLGTAVPVSGAQSNDFQFHVGRFYRRLHLVVVKSISFLSPVFYTPRASQIYNSWPQQEQVNFNYFLNANKFTKEMNFACGKAFD